MANDKMKELFKQLGARVTIVEVEYNQKMSDGDYGSVGGMFRVTAEVAQGSDPVTAIDGLYAWVKERAVANMRESFNEVVRPKKEIDVPFPRTVAQPTKPHVPTDGLDDFRTTRAEEIPFIKGKEPIQVAGEVRTPLDDAGNEVCLMNVESIQIKYNLSNEKVGAVRGKTQDHPSETWPYKGNYTKWGVPLYKDVAKEIDFDIDARDIATYPMEPGFVAIVHIEPGKDGKDKPKKITGWM